MKRKRSSRRKLTGISAAVSVAVLVGLSLNAPAYGAKPDSPPGHGSGGQQPTSGHASKSKASHTSSPKGTTHRGQASGHSTGGNAGTSGNVDEPQPRSNADENGTGANHSGPYDSTREGLPSGNGNGTGKATGKPCAGCVGKADNKNPKGQYPNGSDANAGYECDRNHGIGRTNPAHTGCVTTSRGCVDNPDTPLDECGEVSPPRSESECVDDLSTPEDECAQVSPPGGSQGGPPAAPVSGQSSPTSGATSASSGLPQTGASAALIWAAALGLLLVASGAMVLGRVRLDA